MNRIQQLQNQNQCFKAPTLQQATRVKAKQKSIQLVEHFS